MKVEASYIRLEGLRFRALHGVMPQERQVGGDFLVTLRVGYPLAVAMASDDVKDTLDYAALYRLVEREMLLPSKLLEHVAGRIAEAIEKAKDPDFSLAPEPVPEEVTAEVTEVQGTEEGAKAQAESN